MMTEYYILNATNRLELHLGKTSPLLEQSFSIQKLGALLINASDSKLSIEIILKYTVLNLAL